MFIDKSIDLGIFPTDWKIATVKVSLGAYVIRGLSDVSNLRLVSPLPSKLVDRMMHNKL